MTAQAIKKCILGQIPQARTNLLDRAMGCDIHFFDSTVKWLKDWQHSKAAPRTGPLQGILAVEAAMAISGREIHTLRRVRAHVDVP